MSDEYYMEDSSLTPLNVINKTYFMYVICGQICLRWNWAVVLDDRQEEESAFITKDASFFPVMSVSFSGQSCKLLMDESGRAPRSLRT